MCIRDRPTTGLHFEDVQKLLEVLQALVSLGNSVLVIEHNLDVIKSVSYTHLKRLSELQRDFINNMTHEFKTPIASIKIASDVLANDIKTKEDPRLSRYAQIIREQNSRLNDQVEKVLNIARLEKDSIELKKEWIDLNETLQNIIKAEDVKVTNGTMDWMPGTETRCV